MTVIPTEPVIEQKAPETQVIAPENTITARPSLRFGKKDDALLKALNKALKSHGRVKDAWLIKKYLLLGLQASGFGIKE